MRYRKSCFLVTVLFFFSMLTACSSSSSDEGVVSQGGIFPPKVIERIYMSAPDNGAINKKDLTPFETVAQFYNFANDAKYSKAISFLDIRSRNYFANLFWCSDLKMIFCSKITKNGTIVRLELNKLENVSDTDIVVYSTIVFKDKRGAITKEFDSNLLRKVDGVWKMIFSPPNPPK